MVIFFYMMILKISRKCKANQKQHAIKVHRMPFILSFITPIIALAFTLVFQLEEVCGINVVAHKMKNVSGGI